MIDVMQRHGETTGTRLTAGCLSSIRGGDRFHLVVWLVGACLLAMTPGCGSGSAKKGQSTAVAANQSAQEEEKEAPEEAPAPPVKKKPKQNPFLKAAKIEAPPPAAPNDIRKWKAADLDAAFVRRDLMFIPAVLVYGASDRNDAKRAADLDQLVHKIARMKDDSTIPLPLPSGSFGAEKQPATATGQPAAAAKEAPAGKGGFGYRFGMGRKKKDKDE